VSERLRDSLIQRQPRTLDEAGIGIRKRLESALRLVLSGNLQPKHQRRRTERDEQKKRKRNLDGQT